MIMNVLRRHFNDTNGYTDIIYFPVHSSRNIFGILCSITKIFKNVIQLIIKYVLTTIMLNTTTKYVQHICKSEKMSL